MVFDYTVKHDGKYYPAGTDVPVGGATPKAEPKVETEPVKETPKPQPKAKPTKKK